MDNWGDKDLFEDFDDLDEEERDLLLDADKDLRPERPDELPRCLKLDELRFNESVDDVEDEDAVEERRKSRVGGAAR